MIVEFIGHLIKLCQRKSYFTFVTPIVSNKNLKTDQISNYGGSIASNDRPMVYGQLDPW